MLAARRLYSRHVNHKARSSRTTPGEFSRAYLVTLSIKNFLRNRGESERREALKFYKGLPRQPGRTV